MQIASCGCRFGTTARVAPVRWTQILRAVAAAAVTYRARVGRMVRVVGVVRVVLWGAAHRKKCEARQNILAAAYGLAFSVHSHRIKAGLGQCRRFPHMVG
jgi:hypothetical protein